MRREASKQNYITAFGFARGLLFEEQRLDAEIVCVYIFEKPESLQTKPIKNRRVNAAAY